LSTSATTAMWISVAVTPISVALGFSVLDWAVADVTLVAARAVTTTPTPSTLRNLITVPPSLKPENSLDTSFACPHGGSRAHLEERNYLSEEAFEIASEESRVVGVKMKCRAPASTNLARCRDLLWCSTAANAIDHGWEVSGPVRATEEVDGRRARSVGVAVDAHEDEREPLEPAEVTVPLRAPRRE